jgi:hypothetical protein
VDAPFVVKLLNQDLAPFDHFIDGRAAAGRLADFVEGSPCGLCRLAGRDIRDDSLRLPQNAVVKNDNLQPAFEDPVPEVLDFLAFGIQGAEDQNRPFFFSRDTSSLLDPKSRSSPL